jgi:hypothetical protein
MVQVMVSLRGDEVVPWEGELGEEVNSRLGHLQGCIHAMLDRDPSLRPCMRDFHAALRDCV